MYYSNQRGSTRHPVTRSCQKNAQKTQVFQNETRPSLVTNAVRVRVSRMLHHIQICKCLWSAKWPNYATRPHINAFKTILTLSFLTYPSRKSCKKTRTAMAQRDFLTSNQFIILLFNVV